MIGSLRGTVIDRSSQSLLIEAGGVGYQVTVPTGTMALASLGAPLFVHVHTHVREDAIVLYGFATRDERVCFETLLGVHGVGPSLALALLSTHPPSALHRIAASEDVSALELVPGVGRKTALRLLIELQSKLDLLSDLTVVGSSSEPLADVRAALAGLGYGADEIRDALRDLAPESDPSDLLRSALRSLAGVR